MSVDWTQENRLDFQNIEYVEKKKYQKLKWNAEDQKNNSWKRKKKKPLNRMNSICEIAEENSSELENYTNWSEKII